MEPNRDLPVAPCSEDAVARLEGAELRTLRDLLRAKLYYARERACQALPDHRALPPETLRRTARWLAEKLDTGCEEALPAMLYLAIGLPEIFCQSIPLAGTGIEGWEICLDVEQGVTLVDLDVLAPHRARPSPESGSDALHLAAGILVRPLPELLANELRVLLQLRPFAKTLGELLGHISSISLPGSNEPIATTLPRLLNTLAPCAVELKIDRYSAALITLDPRIVPTGRFYYASISRKDVWTASGYLYENLGWGDPVPLVQGLDIGSAVCPAPATVSNWFLWMNTLVASCAPGRRYSLESLVIHHTVYTRAVASIICFLLAARASKRLRINAEDVGRSYLSFFDKRTGEYPGAHALPVVPILKTQLELYAFHCHALQARLINLEFSRRSRAMRQLQQIDARGNVPLLFEFDSTGHIKVIGTQQLSTWWPQEFGLESNWPRHFWQRALREAGVTSFAIDFFVRHSLAGCDTQSSVSPHCARSIAAQLLPAVQKTTTSLGMTPIAGIGRKERNNGI